MSTANRGKDNLVKPNDRSNVFVPYPNETQNRDPNPTLCLHDF